MVSNRKDSEARDGKRRRYAIGIRKVRVPQLHERGGTAARDGGGNVCKRGINTASYPAMVMKSSTASGITRLSLSAWRPFMRTLKSTRAVQRFTFLARFLASVLNLLDFSLRISNPIYQSSTTLSSFFLARVPFDITPFPGVAVSVKASAAALAEVTVKDRK